MSGFTEINQFEKPFFNAARIPLILYEIILGKRSLFCHLQRNRILKIIRYIFVLSAFLSVQTGFGQNLKNNLRIKQFEQIKDSVYLDSSFISISSVKLIAEGDTISPEQYHVNPYSKYLVADTPLSNVTILYRVFYFPFDSVYFRKKLIFDEKKQNYFLNTAHPQSSQFELIASDKLRKSGSISRGVLFGNNRNLSVNSDLNLQIDGQLTDNLFVKAVITDNNIPIEPEGNTAQLQDFDKIFIQLYNDNLNVTFGDFPFKRQEPHYLKLYKKTQGVGGNYVTKNGISSNNIGFTAGLSRGKFARNVIQGIEGNQGPYRLKGANNENFIIVLSGTERVYIDGKLLQRGQEYDYIIDYNTAELTFTAKQLITKDKRIVVEFQYSDRNYVRSLFRFSNDWVTKKNTLRLDVYSEQDVKNQPLNQDLTDEQKKLLSEIGDSLHKAIVPGYQLSEFSDDAILYKLDIDTLTGDSIFIFSTNPDSAVYKVTFSYVGQGRGAYQLQESTANGKIFKYAGKNQGDYLPLSYLYAPAKQQVASLGGIYKINQANILKYEVAVSNNDINTFSKKDSQDNIGIATFAEWNNEVALDDSSKWKLKTAFFVETLTENFKGIDRFRKPEFFRNWNLRNVKLTESQIYSGIKWQLVNDNQTDISTSFQTYFTPEEYQGYQNYTRIIHKSKYLYGNIKNYVTYTDGNIVKSRFIRNLSDVLYKQLPVLDIGWNNDFENNRFYDITQPQSLTGNSYQFLEWKTFVQSKDTAKNLLKAAYIERTDNGLKNNRLATATVGRTVQLEVTINAFKNQRIGLRSAYRILKIADSTITTQKADSTLLNRLEYSSKLWKGAIRTVLFYEVGSGMEIKKDFTYIEVPAGQGVYVFNDYNDNGIKELNEFEPAVFQDQANYIRVYTPTNEFVKVFTNQYSQTLYFIPRIVWHNKDGLRKLLSKFQNQFSVQRTIKHTASEWEYRFGAFIQTPADSFLQSQTSLLRNVFSFNKSNPVFGVDITAQSQRNKVLLVNGFSETNKDRYGARIRWNITNYLLAVLEWNEGYKQSVSDFMSNRNYLYDFTELTPKISWQPNTKFRLTLNYGYQEKINRPDLGNEKAFITRVGAETRWNSVKNGVLTILTDFYNISYNGNSGTSIAYDMLQGLNPGYNLVWQVFFQKNVAQNLQISINYNGRGAPGQKVIHTGGVQARAFF